MSSPKWLLPASLFLGGVLIASYLWEAFQDQQVSLTQVPFRLLPLHWDSECVRCCVGPLRVESLFPIAFWLSYTKAQLAFKARNSEVSSSWCGIPGMGSLMWGSDPLILGENLCNCDSSPVCGSPESGVSLDYTASLPLLPISLWFLRYSFCCRRFFLIVFQSFSSIVVP